MERYLSSSLDGGALSETNIGSTINWALHCLTIVLGSRFGLIIEDAAMDTSVASTNKKLGANALLPFLLLPQN